MGFFDKFRNKEEDNFDPLADLTLSKLKPGFFVDYDLKTWEVKRYIKTDFGDGYQTDEWEIESPDGKRYLERAEDDEITWSLSKKIPIGKLGAGISKHIIDNEDPPEQIEYEGKTYYLDESGAGRTYEDGKGVPGEFIYWDFIDDDDETFVTIEQWGETEFEASAGFYVEECRH